MNTKSKITVIFLAQFLAYQKLEFSLSVRKKKKEKENRRGSVGSGDTERISIFEKLSSF